MNNTIIHNVSVDCVIFGFDTEQLNVLLVKRTYVCPETKKVLIDDWTLSGHHMFEEEELDVSAKRILKDRTGLDNIYMEQFGTFGELDRIKNEKDIFWINRLDSGISCRTITVGYYALIDNTKVTLPEDGHAQWFPINNLPDLAFDHERIINNALGVLRGKLQNNPIGFELLPDKFTLSQLQKLYEAILGRSYDRRNFRKKVSQMKYVIALGEKQKGVQHKPAQLYIFSSDVYKKTRKTFLDFSV